MRRSKESDARSNRFVGVTSHLQSEPRRGFMLQETFDLSHDITLVYGANGTGKSSFCEALETAMLGSISEAQVKRVDLRNYCNNARLRRHITPVLKSVNAAGNEAARTVQPNENEYRFCFIEKNRLDDFARIAARTPGDQRQLIATLFGVDQFSEFVRSFNPSLDENLTLVGAKAFQLEQRRAQLVTSEQVIHNDADRQAQFQLQEQELAQRISPGHSFEDCCAWMLGTPAQQGRLPYIQAQLDAVPPTIHQSTQARLRDLLAEAYRLQALFQDVSAQLNARAGDVSYSQLYRAVLELAEGATACPACGTNLDATAQNPFDRARVGLQQLEALAALQERAAALRDQLGESVRALLDAMRHAVADRRN